MRRTLFQQDNILEFNELNSEWNFGFAGAGHYVGAGRRGVAVEVREGVGEVHAAGGGAGIVAGGGEAAACAAAGVLLHGVCKGVVVIFEFGILGNEA